MKARDTSPFLSTQHLSRRRSARFTARHVRFPHEAQGNTRTVKRAPNSALAVPQQSAEKGSGRPRQAGSERCPGPHFFSFLVLCVRWIFDAPPFYVLVHHDHHKLPIHRNLCRFSWRGRGSTCPILPRLPAVATSFAAALAAASSTSTPQQQQPQILQRAIACPFPTLVR